MAMNPKFNYILTALVFTFAGWHLRGLFIAPMDTTDYTDKIAELDARIASEQSEADYWRRIADETKAKTDTVIKYITRVKYQTAQLPPIQRDSMFTATTDTVKLNRDNTPKMVEGFRLSAANVLFSELHETKRIVDLQVQTISAQDSVISNQTSALELHEEKDVIQEHALDSANNDAMRERRRKRIWQGVAGVVTILAIL